MSTGGLCDQHFAEQLIYGHALRLGFSEKPLFNVRRKI
jgi:hypothetical protein